MADTVPIIWGGAHSGVYDSASEADAWDGDIDQVEPDSSQSYRTPAPCV